MEKIKKINLMYIFSLNTLSEFGRGSDVAASPEADCSNRDGEEYF